VTRGDWSCCDSLLRVQPPGVQHEQEWDENQGMAMTDDASLLGDYLEHLDARIRARSNTPTAKDEEEGLARLPQTVEHLCAANPPECLALIVQALREVQSPHLVQAIGEELLDNLLNEHAAALDTRIAVLLRTDQQFRFAFASGKHSSVDPALADEWVQILQDLGTTKQRERKRLWALLGGRREP
jgi:hypothetical protein